MAHSLSYSARKDLIEGGFVVIRGPIPENCLESMAEAYEAVAAADPADVGIGEMTT
jgi:hypothetical protein